VRRASNAVAVLLALLAGVARPAGGVCTGGCPAAALPGPHRVGVTGFTATYVSPLAETRPLVTEVWYPADAQAAGAPEDPRFGGVRDAAPARGRFPLLVFSHGFSNGQGARGAYPAYARHLASHGFIVAAPDHPNDTVQAFARSIVQRPYDGRADADRFVLVCRARP
jgi:predicted dienelactone hydrolase